EIAADHPVELEPERPPTRDCRRGAGGAPAASRGAAIARSPVIRVARRVNACQPFAAANEPEERGPPSIGHHLIVRIVEEAAGRAAWGLLRGPPQGSNCPLPRAAALACDAPGCCGVACVKAASSSAVHAVHATDLADSVALIGPPSSRRGGPVCPPGADT